MTFRGFSRAALAFYEGLEADNSKAYWQANKSIYDSEVRAAMLALLDELGDRGPFRLFRPFHDARFAKGRPPYKEQIGAVGESEGGSTFYLAFSAGGLLVGSGYYSMAADQLMAFRRAVDDDRHGSDLEAICAALERAGYGLSALEQLKTAPRGFAKDHPRIEILRRKGLVATKSWAPQPWLHTSAVVDRVRSAWKGSAPLYEWLDTNVGPSTLPPQDWDR